MAGVATQRIDLHTSVAIAFPRSPMICANIGWDIAASTGGRFTLGLGSQVRTHVERRFGTDFERPAARMRETVEAVRAVLGLTVGNVIRMERSAGENIDVLIGGRLVGSGEIMIIEENFGVRITDFMEPG